MSNIDQDSSIDWARQAYEQLKQKQTQEKEEIQKLEREAQEKEKRFTINKHKKDKFLKYILLIMEKLEVY